MKFTSYDLMNAMGFQVGDRVRVDTFDNSDFEVREAYDMGHKEIVLVDDNEEMFSLTLAFGYDYEILLRPKRVGELKCKEQECRTCPIRFICQEDRPINNTLYFNLELYKKDQSIHYDQEIYDLLKARLDKEVEE